MSTTLLLGDCLHRMKEIPDGSVDMVLADLPYGTTSNKWDKEIPLHPLWEQYERVITETGAIVLFGSEPFSSKLRCSRPELYKYDWVWVKNRATGHVHAKNKPMKKHENIMVFSKGTTVHASQSKSRMTYNPQGLIKMPEGTVRRRNDLGDDSVMSKRSSHHATAYEYSGYPTSILEFPIEMGDKRYHPTQKPVPLLEYMIRTYTHEGDTVLDNCMGSGSTGVAAINTGRNFIGIEISAEYYAVATGRISQAEAAKKQEEEHGQRKNAQITL